MTQGRAKSEAQTYVDKLVRAQNQLGYQRPSKGVVDAAVSEAAVAMRALAALSEKK